MGKDTDIMKKAPFTTRFTPRKTSSWTKTADGFAKIIITTGGLVTIFSVFAVGFFLLAVALPLFKPVLVETKNTATATHITKHSSCLGVDDSGLVAWILNAEQSHFQFLDLSNGNVLGQQASTGSGLENMTAIHISPPGLDAVCGFADGTLRKGQLGLQSSFVPDIGTNSSSQGQPSVDVQKRHESIFVRNENGQMTRLSFVAEFPAQLKESLNSKIIDVDSVMLNNGLLVTALGSDGRILLRHETSRENLLTNETKTTIQTTVIEPPSLPESKHPLFICTSGLGDQLFVFFQTGTAYRYNIRSIEKPQLMETFESSPNGIHVTAVKRLYGGNAIAVANMEGTIRIFFTSRGATQQQSIDGLTMIAAKAFSTSGAITALAASPRSRLLAAANTSGELLLLQTTTNSEIHRLQPTQLIHAPAHELVISPRENFLIAHNHKNLITWNLDIGHPEVSVNSLFKPLWYENYSGPVHAWETTGHDSFEAKFSLIPLIFGTVKASVYSVVFAAPIAILAAIFSSQFLTLRWRSRIKPMIEMMASLPSVVLGFLAGLIFAPMIEQALLPTLILVFTIPFTCLLFAHLWQFIPEKFDFRLSNLRFFIILLIALPLALVLSMTLAPGVEQFLFSGEISSWLDGRDSSSFGGWLVAALPLCSILTCYFVSRTISPLLCRCNVLWVEKYKAIISLCTFLFGTLLAIAFAIAVALFLDAIRIDTRGNLFGTYVQRNALVVAVGMSFAIIPIIFTIADDALSSVSDHLRNASLSAGATPWQTTVRIIIPTAASGLFSAVLIGFGRVIGETMIVLMAAGNTPILSWNIFSGFQTLSAAIATELPDSSQGSTHYRVLFLAALALFAMTFLVNTTAEIVRQHFRRQVNDL